MAAMFSGNEIKQAPGFSSCASLNALRVISGTTSGSRICVAYLVMGSKIFTRSSTWCDSLCSRVVAAWPAIATSGA